MRAVAKQFLVNPDTVQRRLKPQRLTGDLKPPKCGSRQKRVLSQPQATALKVVEDHPDWTLWQSCEFLTAPLGVKIRTRMMTSFCHAHHLTLQKKTARSEKVSTPAVQQARVKDGESIQGVAPEKLVLLDETGFWVGDESVSGKGRQRKKADRLREFYRGKQMTIIGAIKQGAVLTTKSLEGSMKGPALREFMRLKLVPKLAAGAVVVLANLQAHHREEVRAMIEAVGAKSEDLPVYSPDFNPIAMMWLQLKSLVRKFRTKTVKA